MSEYSTALYTSIIPIGSKEHSKKYKLKLFSFERRSVGSLVSVILLSATERKLF